MATVILLDTHVIVWLYEDPNRPLPSRVRERLSAERPGLSPFVRLELRYLEEAKKLSVHAESITDDLVPKLEMFLTDPPCSALYREASILDWTRDPFDRLISAEAMTSGATLVTKDRVIRRHLPSAWWAT